MKPPSIVTRVLAALAVVFAGLTTFAVFAPAQASDEYYDGRTTTKLVVRKGPSTETANLKTLAKGQRIQIACKVAGTNVRGNYRWYGLAGNRGWVSAKYVDNIGQAPEGCPQDYLGYSYGVGKAKAPLVKRDGTTVRDTRRGEVAPGTQFRVKCYASGDKIRDTTQWYYLESGKWVSAAYVERVERSGTDWVRCGN